MELFLTVSLRLWVLGWDSLWGLLYNKSTKLEHAEFELYLLQLHAAYTSAQKLMTLLVQLSVTGKSEAMAKEE